MNNKILVIIPARGGSKGVPGKNIKCLNRVPLIHYTISAALDVINPEAICVTTDSQLIKEVSEETGLKIPFLRPKELATDTSSSYDVILHTINFYEENFKYFPDIVILLQPTSPFRTSKHILEALELFDGNTEAVVSVKETKSNPYFVLMEENKDGWLEKSKVGNFTRRQDCPKVYELNGAIYIISVKKLKEKPIGEMKQIRKYVMDEISSHDIDTILDWEIAEFLINKKEFKNII